MLLCAIPDPAEPHLAKVSPQPRVASEPLRREARSRIQRARPGLALGAPRAHSLEPRAPPTHPYARCCRVSDILGARQPIEQNHKESSSLTRKRCMLATSSATTRKQPGERHPAPPSPARSRSRSCVSKRLDQAETSRDTWDGSGQRFCQNAQTRPHPKRACASHLSQLSPDDQPWMTLVTPGVPGSPVTSRSEIWSETRNRLGRRPRDTRVSAPKDSGISATPSRTTY